MLNLSTWMSFEKRLTAEDVADIEKRLAFLRDVLEDALTQFHVENISSELDLNMHIYLMYFELIKNKNLSPWLIHDSWLSYFMNENNLNSNLKNTLENCLLQSEENLFLDISNYLRCLECDKFIAKEIDAVVWLSFLDYMASKIIYQIGHQRMVRLFQNYSIKCSSS